MADENWGTVIYGDGTRRSVKEHNIPKVIKVAEEMKEIARKAGESEQETEILSVTIIRDDE